MRPIIRSPAPPSSRSCWQLTNRLKIPHPTPPPPIAIPLRRHDHQVLAVHEREELPAGLGRDLTRARVEGEEGLGWFHSATLILQISL